MDCWHLSDGEKRAAFLICLLGLCGSPSLLAHGLISHKDKLYLSVAISKTWESIKDNPSVNVALCQNPFISYYIKFEFRLTKPSDTVPTKKI